MIKNKLELLVSTDMTQVSLCLRSAEKLRAQDVLARVIVRGHVLSATMILADLSQSMPCMEVFMNQSSSYRASVLRRGHPILSVEVLSTNVWPKA